MASRLEMLHQYYIDDPDDPFNIYALALEYQKVDLLKTEFYFNILLTKHPTYIPVYYHAGKLYEELGEKNRAVEIFEAGINYARAAKDLKAVRELTSALNELMYD
jgi:tetratricopeptide (TPR) repeat protein